MICKFYRLSNEVYVLVIITLLDFKIKIKNKMYDFYTGAQSTPSTERTERSSGHKKGRRLNFKTVVRLVQLSVETKVSGILLLTFFRL